jgi:hypothetical protein
MHSNPVKLAAIAAFGAAAFYKASTIIEIFFQNTILASWLGIVSILLLFPSSTLMIPGFPQVLLEFISRLAFLKVIFFPIWLIIAGWILANRVNVPSLRLVHS